MWLCWVVVLGTHFSINIMASNHILDLGKIFAQADFVQIPNNQYVNIFNCILILYFFCREHHPKQEDLADVLNMSEMEFFRHLRLTRKSFDDTLDLIHKAYGEEPSGTSLYLGPRKSLYLTL